MYLSPIVECREFFLAVIFQTCARFQNNIAVLKPQTTLVSNDDVQVTFTCPALSMLRSLQKDVADIKKQLSSTYSKSTELIDNADLLILYKISRTTSCEWRQKGLEYFKVGKKIMYERSAIDAFLLKHKHRGF